MGLPSTRLFHGHALCKPWSFKFRPSCDIDSAALTDGRSVDFRPARAAAAAPWTRGLTRGNGGKDGKIRLFSAWRLARGGKRAMLNTRRPERAAGSLETEQRNVERSTRF